MALENLQPAAGSTKNTQKESVEVKDLVQVKLQEKVTKVKS